ncbi:PilZ domain-containing protein [Vibrio renipiscarius]|uniref:PilZ domain-containing protein n=1 Tax=Vibrio renipiscarius TaxID=1461322 RepID=UPI003552B5FB
MNSQTAKNSAATAQRVHPDTRVTSILNSADALPMIDHGRDVSIGIITPVGNTYRARSHFIGTHSKHMILIELPKISDDDLHAFFQEGFWATIRTISPHGEGAIFSFRSQILHVIKAPIAMVAMSIPQTLQSTPLRSDPRYEVNLPAKAHINEHRIECVLRDLSKSGCLYLTPSLTRPFISGENVELHIRTPGSQYIFETLTGTICNVKQTAQTRRYGVQFDERGRNNATTLLSLLKFDGNRLSLD